jgi:hypothetical protein
MFIEDFTNVKQNASIALLYNSIIVDEKGEMSTYPQPREDVVHKTSPRT